jgi:hypothetical protein
MDRGCVDQGAVGASEPGGRDTTRTTGKDRQYTYNVTMGGVCVTIFVVGKQ